MIVKSIQLNAGCSLLWHTQSFPCISTCSVGVCSSSQLGTLLIALNFEVQFVLVAFPMSDTVSTTPTAESVSSNGNVESIIIPSLKSRTPKEWFEFAFINRSSNGNNRESLDFVDFVRTGKKPSSLAMDTQTFFPIWKSTEI